MVIKNKYCYMKASIKYGTKASHHARQPVSRSGLSSVIQWFIYA